MDDDTLPPDADEPEEGEEPEETEASEPHEHVHEHGHQHNWPRRQIYFVTIEWQDEAHQPESPERIARAIRQVLEHAHNVPAGTPPARFSVRVKADDVAVEIEGKVEHHHHH
jgi:hypothetical protein